MINGGLVALTDEVYRVPHSRNLCSSQMLEILRMQIWSHLPSRLAILRISQRGFAVKKKPNYADQPHKINKPVLVKTLRGFQFTDGEHVYAGDILVRQLGLEFYPGENVKLNRDTWDLVALRDGRFTISTETLSPYPDSPLYPLVKEGRELRKPFVHVVARPVEPVFKLKRNL
nr:unnamed protein product [Spirometra erinaceieuropaei]